MKLKVILPYEVFLDLQDVLSVTVETTGGYYGILPNRLDATAAIVPGILTYRTKEGHENYIALDEGVLVKEGNQVWIASRHAAGGVDLDQLHVLVQRDFMQVNEEEKEMCSVLSRLESGFIRHFKKLQTE